MQQYSALLRLENTSRSQTLTDLNQYYTGRPWQTETPQNGKESTGTKKVERGSAGTTTDQKAAPEIPPMPFGQDLAPQQLEGWYTTVVQHVSSETK